MWQRSPSLKRPRVACALMPSSAKGAWTCASMPSAMTVGSPASCLGVCVAAMVLLLTHPPPLRVRPAGIKEWSAESNTCPLCQARFHKLTKHDVRIPAAGGATPPLN